MISLFLSGILFTIFNYSETVWIFFYNLGGLALAKTGPEFIGIAIYLLFAYIAFKNFAPARLKFDKKDTLIIISLLVITILPRLQEFKLYFYADDFYFWLNRAGTSYSVYQWGPWLSSHPGWVWELTRFIGGYNPGLYQLFSLFSHFLFGFGIYFLAKCLAKSRAVGFWAATFFLLTTIHFEAFQWLSHITAFGWQGLLMTFSVLALIWQREKDNGKNPPYLASYLMMAALFAGTARTGAILPIVSTVDFILSMRAREKIVQIAKRQAVFYFPVFVFILTRGLLAASSPRYEAQTVSLFGIFFWLFGVFTVPPEFIKFFSFITTEWLGMLTVALGFGAFAIGFALWLKSIKKANLIILVAFTWTVMFALYFTLFGPHVPVTFATLRERMGPHHLAYPSAVGISLIFGLFFTTVIKKVGGSLILPLSVLTILYLAISVNNFYSQFLYLPYKAKMAREEFFFTSYKKFIPEDVKILYVYYDNDYLKNKWNFAPPAEYFLAFWPTAEVHILEGEKDLKKVTGQSRDNLYYIKVDFEIGTAEDLSKDIRTKI